MNLSQNLIRILGQKGVTQRELANAVGTTEMFMSYVVNGYKLPSLAVTVRMAEYLNVTLDELVR